MEVSQTARFARLQLARAEKPLNDHAGAEHVCGNAGLASSTLWPKASPNGWLENPAAALKVVHRRTRLLTLKEAATYLALSLSTIKKMLISGELKVVSRGGSRNDRYPWLQPLDRATQRIARA